jgi:signal peptidase I
MERKIYLLISFAFLLIGILMGIMLFIVVGQYFPEIGSIVFGNSTKNGLAPGDWITKNDIILQKDKIIINVENASLSNYADSGSMLPVLDYESNGIRIVPSDAEQIEVGDIVTFSNENIVHRVIEKGEDEEGYWFITKGDNNDINDAKIRFQDIKYVTIGILY